MTPTVTHPTTPAATAHRTAAAPRAATDRRPASGPDAVAPADRAAADVRASAAAPPTPVRRLTGHQPTGRLQLGNYLSAIRPMVAGQDPSRPYPDGRPRECLVAVADLHALTVEHRPHEVRARTLELATTLLAAGVDPQRTILFVQSHVPEHTELHYLLECVTGYGEARRMIQFKEKSRSQRHVRLSLLTYPVLMASDILLYDTDEVPVGEDQAQHLELARQVATRFNHRYGDTFTVPTAVTPEVAARLMDLANPTAKMRKSAATGAGVIYLLDPPDVIRRKVRAAVTDSEGEVRYDPDTKPGVSNLLEILAACVGGSPATVAAEFSSYGRLKQAVTEAVIDTLVPIQHRYARLAAEPQAVREVLAAGAARARERAAATLARARRAIGLLPA
ncbi:MAG: tryptophan--tRNA ligase [Micromonosporaceae bacterium]|jgi:tryptophanyl-tRNA synthetase